MNSKLENLLIDLEEVRAYRELSGASFDFGAGIITNDSTKGEDAYYKQREKAIVDRMDDYLYFNRLYLSCTECPLSEYCGNNDCYFALTPQMETDEIKSIIRYVLERSSVGMEKDRMEDLELESLMRKEKSQGSTSNVRKKEDKRRMKYMVNEQYDEENDSYYHKRYYLSGRKSFAKKESNKRVRKYRPYVRLKGAEYRKIYDYWWMVY